MKFSCYRCNKEWEQDNMGGFFTGNPNQRICFDCHKKEMDEYHERRIKDLNRDLLETDIINQILQKLENK